MREYKFRAWHEGRSSYHYEPQMIYDEKPGDCLVWKNQGQPLTLMQWTGLVDRNGKEIYEGDAVKYLDAYSSSSESGEDWEEIVSVGEIKWDNNQAQFYVTRRESVDLEVFWEDIDQAEVIGNIYENPELIEVQP